MKKLNKDRWDIDNSFYSVSDSFLKVNLISSELLQLLRKAVLSNEYDLVKEEFDTIENILTELPDFCPNAIEHILEN